MYYVYVLFTLNDEHYYIGYSQDVEKRLECHNNDTEPSTKGRKWKLVYYEAYVSRSFAIKRERALKRNARMRQFLMNRIHESLK